MEFSQAFDPFRTLPRSWELFKRAPGPLFVGAFLLAMTEGGGGGGGNWGDALRGLEGGADNACYGGGGYNTPQYSIQAADDLEGLLNSMGNDADMALALPLILMGLLCISVLVIGVFCLRVWVETGYIRCQRDVTLTGNAEFGTLFGGADRFVDMALWKLLSGTIAGGTLIVAAAPGGAVAVLGGMQDSDLLLFGGLGVAALIALPAMAYVGLGLHLGRTALVLEDLGPIAALDRSWSLASGNRLSLLWFGFINAMAAFAAVFVGLMMCCVGVIATSPIARAVVDTGTTEAFLQFTRGDLPS